MLRVVPLLRDSREFESHFAMNRLGYFHLTNRLRPALQQDGSAPLISVSALAHGQAPIAFEDLKFERREDVPWMAYGQSKTANILFAVSLDDQARAEGARTFPLHPGTITPLSKHI